MVTRRPTENLAQSETLSSLAGSSRVRRWRVNWVTNRLRPLINASLRLTPNVPYYTLWATLQAQSVGWSECATLTRKLKDKSGTYSILRLSQAKQMLNSLIGCRFGKECPKIHGQGTTTRTMWSAELTKTKTE